MSTIKRITLYGIAPNRKSGRIVEMREVRCPMTRPGLQELTGRTWPDTKRGWKDAMAENGRMNLAAEVETVDESEALPVVTHEAFMANCARINVAEVA